MNDEELRNAGALIVRMQNSKCKIQNLGTLRVDCKLSCSGAKPILLASFSSEGGGPFFDNTVVTVYLPRVINWFIKYSSGGMVEGTFKFQW